MANWNARTTAAPSCPAAPITATIVIVIGLALGTVLALDRMPRDIFPTLGVDGNPDQSVLSYEHFTKTRHWYQKHDLSHIDRRLVVRDHALCERRVGVDVPVARGVGRHRPRGTSRTCPGTMRLPRRLFADRIRGVPAGLHVQFGDAAVVAVEDRHEVFGEVVLVLAGELAHDPEVQGDEARVGAARWVGIHPDVAGVGVGMEEVVAEHLGVEHAYALGRKRPAIEDLPHLMATPTGLSFPSSHSTSSFAAARAFGALVPGAPLQLAACAVVALDAALHERDTAALFHHVARQRPDRSGAAR